MGTAASGMRKPECRMSKSETNPNDQTEASEPDAFGYRSGIRISSFGFRIVSSFGIRHSGFSPLQAIDEE